MTQFNYLTQGGGYLYPGGLPNLALVLLYLGPETVMPLASILAAILGILLIFWRFILKGIKKLFRSIFHKPSSEPAEDNLGTSGSVNEYDEE
jgi:hypothetical protein